MVLGAMASLSWLAPWRRREKCLVNLVTAIQISSNFSLLSIKWVARDGNHGPFLKENIGESFVPNRVRQRVVLWYWPFTLHLLDLNRSATQPQPNIIKRTLNSPEPTRQDGHSSWLDDSCSQAANMWKQQRQFKQGIATCQAWCSSWSLWWHLDFQEETCPDMSGSVSLYSNTWLSESLSGTRHTLWNQSMIRWCSVSIPFWHLNWHHWHHVWTSQLSSTGEFNMEPWNWLITGGWPGGPGWLAGCDRMVTLLECNCTSRPEGPHSMRKHGKAWESYAGRPEIEAPEISWNVDPILHQSSSYFIIVHFSHGAGLLC